MIEADVVNSMNEYLLKHGICYANEIRMGIGIPDISFNLGGNRRIKCVDDYYLISIWDYVFEKKRTTINEIKEKFRFSINKVKKYVFQLVSMKLAAIKNEVIWSIYNIKEVNLGITISVEAKISDWKNGLIQAQRYLLFSDYSYLALPVKNTKHVDCKLLEEYGIGLISIGEKDLEEVIPARKSMECKYDLKYMHTSVIFDRYKNNNHIYIRKKENVFSKLIRENSCNNN